MDSDSDREITWEEFVAFQVRSRTLGLVVQKF